MSRRLARAVNASLVVIASQPLAAREMLQGFAADSGMAPGPTAVVTAEAGHVRLAVQTYTRLLGSLSTCDCNLLAQELICTKPVRKHSALDISNGKDSERSHHDSLSLPACVRDCWIWFACCSTAASGDWNVPWKVVGGLRCKASGALLTASDLLWTGVAGPSSEAVMLFRCSTACTRLDGAESCS